MKMSYRCVNGGTCIGCGDCNGSRVRSVCEICGETILENDECFEIMGTYLGRKCVEQARLEAESDMVCSICSEPIFEGDDYYDMNGEKLCQECVLKASQEELD